MVSIDKQIACVGREVRLRKVVYQRLVTDGKMRQIDANDELVTMEAVLCTLRAVQRAQSMQQELFAEKEEV